MTSDEQNQAITSPTPVEWEPLELKSGPIPDWFLDAEIDWHTRYANRPTLHILVLPDFSEMPDLWTYENRRYSNIAPDGRAQFHYHGPLIKQKEIAGELRWVTKQDEGYAGRHFPITMADGRKATLRGPWHGGAPKGFCEVTHHIAGRYPGEGYIFGHMGYFGMYLTEELTLRIYAYLTLLGRVAGAVRVRLPYGARIEPLSRETNAPKGW